MLFNSNPELLKQLKIIQTQQKWIPVLTKAIPRIADQVKETIVQLLQRMLGQDFGLNTQEHKDMFVLMCNKLCS